MNKDSLVTTNTYGSGVDKTDAGTGPQQDFFDEYGHGKQYLLLRFHKMVIRNLTRKKGVSDVYRHISYSTA